jgi:hypothetical protein
MSNNIKSILLVVAILAAIFFIGWFIGHKNGTAPVYVLADTTSYERNRKDQEVAARIFSEMTEKAFKKAFDSVAKIFNSKASNLTGYVQAVSHGTANLAPDSSAHSIIGVADPDSVTWHSDFDSAQQPCPQVKAMEQSFSSQYYKAKVRVGDSAYLHLERWDTTWLGLTKYKVGRQWFTQARIVDADSGVHTTIIGANKIADVEYSRWSIAAFGGVGASAVQPNRITGVAGIGVAYDLIRFKKKR